MELVTQYCMPNSVPKRDLREFFRDREWLVSAQFQNAKNAVYTTGPLGKLGSGGRGAVASWALSHADRLLDVKPQCLFTNMDGSKSIGLVIVPRWGI